MKQEADHRFNGKKNTNINPRTHEVPGKDMLCYIKKTLSQRETL